MLAHPTDPQTSSSSSKPYAKKKATKFGHIQDQSARWPAKKNHLLREGTLLRWRSGYSNLADRIGTIELEQDDDSGSSDDTLVEQHRYKSPADDVRIRQFFERARGLSYGQIGGLRTDPFNALPIPPKGEVPVTFDFLAQHWAHIDMSDMRRGDDGRPLLYSTYFASLLNDPMVFQVMMAFCMLVQTLKRGAEPKLSVEALYHSTNCVAILRERLQLEGEEATSDMVICTIVVLGAMALMTKDFRSLEFHVKGVQKCIDVRGGYDKLGWDGYVATRSRQIEAGWLAVQRAEKDRAAQGSDSIDKLVYPKHPFSPELCARLAQLPQGFSDLALKGKLSLRFLSIIEEVTAWDRVSKSATEAINTSPGSLPAMFLGVPDQTQTEALLALTFLAYCAFRERSMGMSQPAFEGSLKFYSQGIINDMDIWNLKTQDAFIWSALMLNVITDPKSETREWAQMIIDDIQPSEKRKQELDKLFLAVPHE